MPSGRISRLIGISAQQQYEPAVPCRRTSKAGRGSGFGKECPHKLLTDGGVRLGGGGAGSAIRESGVECASLFTELVVRLPVSPVLVLILKDQSEAPPQSDQQLRHRYLNQLLLELRVLLAHLVL